MADGPDSKSGGRKAVMVRPHSPALMFLGMLGYQDKVDVMYAPVSRILTSFSWQEIAGYHPREVRESQAGAFDCFEGVFVNERTQGKKPFRFYAHRGVNIDSLAYPVWP